MLPDLCVSCGFERVESQCWTSPHRSGTLNLSLFLFWFSVQALRSTWFCGAAGSQKSGKHKKETLLRFH